jgi:hypothetical protein
VGAGRRSIDGLVGFLEKEMVPCEVVRENDFSSVKKMILSARS